MRRLLHTLIARAVVQCGAKVINAIPDDRPAVVFSSTRNVQLVAATWAVRKRPQGTGERMNGRALQIAVAVAPDFLEATRRFDRRIISSVDSMAVISSERITASAEFCCIISRCLKP